jgi:hypothetical protein
VVDWKKTGQYRRTSQLNDAIEAAKGETSASLSAHPQNDHRMAEPEELGARSTDRRSAPEELAASKRFSA